MLSSLIKGIQQLSDAKTRKYIWFSILGAVITFAILWSIVGWLLSETSISQTGWLESIIDVLGGAATLLLTWFLFPATVTAVIGLFLDSVADCVEERHYPAVGKADGQPIGEAIITTLKFFGMLIVLNILMLPFLFIAPLYPFVFYSVNGYLLGREYFELVASRRLGIKDVTALRKSHSVSVWMMGVAIAFLLTIPLVNLLMPVIATSAMVHLYHKWQDGHGNQSVSRT